MRNVLLGAAAHALVFVCAGAVLIVFALLGYRAAPPGAGDAAFTAALLVLAAGGLGTLAFAPVIAASPTWRNQSVRSCLVIGASLAILTAFFQASGLGMLPLRLILPSAIASAWPRTAGAVLLAFPGVLTGFLGGYIARSRAVPAGAG